KAGESACPTLPVAQQFWGIGSVVPIGGADPCSAAGLPAGFSRQSEILCVRPALARTGRRGRRLRTRVFEKVRSMDPQVAETVWLRCAEGLTVHEMSRPQRREMWRFAPITISAYNGWRTG